MDEWTAETFLANRDEPIPAITVQGGEDASSDRDSKDNTVKPMVSRSERSSQSHGSTSAKHTRHPSIQDRLLTKLLQQVIPGEELSDDTLFHDGPTSKYLNRPGFSLGLMSNNFRRFNARIGVVFVFQAQAIRLFTWQRYSHTLSFLAIYSFVCVYPYLLSILPCCLLLFFIFVPAYLARHPPPPTSTTTTAAQYTLSGPPIAPARVIKPATEMSRDFFHNMRDLQNVMDDFSVVHDLVLDAITPLTNFSREALSSTLFMLLCCLTCALFLAAPLLPWRQICLVGGWALVSMGHPAVQTLAQRTYADQVEGSIKGAGSWFQDWSTGDIATDGEPEILEVEVFELQRRRAAFSTNPSAISGWMGEDDGNATDGSTGASSAVAEWEGWLFSPSAWEPQAPARVAGERPKGTRFFEDVKPPEGWEWGGKKWLLDLGSQEWVEARMLGGLEVEVEGERWVYDMSEAKRISKGGKKSSKESVWTYEAEGRGEWRRRRWVRLVKRSKVRGDAPKVMATGA